MWNLPDEAIKLAGTRLVEAGFFGETQNANGFKEAQCPQCIYICGVFGGFEADGDLAHGSEVVDFVGLLFLNDTNQVAGV